MMFCIASPGPQSVLAWQHRRYRGLVIKSPPQNETVHQLIAKSLNMATLGPVLLTIFSQTLSAQSGTGLYETH